MDSFLSRRKNIADSIVSDIVNKKYQTINICGAPGTGKTYLMDYCISSINVNYKKIAIIQLYGDKGKQSIQFLPLETYLSKKNRWKENAEAIGTIIETTFSLPPITDSIIKANDIIHMLDRDDIIKSNEILSSNIPFSKEIYSLLKTYDHIVISCDDYQYMDSSTIKYLQNLIPLFYEKKVPISILVACRTTENPLILTRYKAKKITIDYPSKEDITDLLQAWCPSIDCSNLQIDAIYAATGGHLLLLRHVCQYLNKNSIKALTSAGNDYDYYTDLINQRIRETESGEVIIQLLSCLAAIGREASIYELKCVLRQQSICPAINEAVSMNLLTKNASSICFINDSLREMNLRNNTMDLNDFYLRYSGCLKVLMPSEYARRALAEKLAGRNQQSQILTGLHLISQIREGLSVDIEHAITDDEVRDATTIIAEGYRLAFEGITEQAIIHINNNIVSIKIPLLLAEAKYAVCVLQFKTNRKEDRIDALESAKSLMDSYGQEEFDLWGRLIRLCISLHCSLNQLLEARDLYQKYRKELINRLEYDRKSRHAYYELLLLSDSIYDPNVAHMTLQEMLREIEGLINKGETDYIALLYKTLVNLSSNCIEIGQFKEAGQYAFRALHIAEEFDYMHFANIEAAFNNYLLAMNFQNAYSCTQLLEEFSSVIRLHFCEEDGLLIKLNYTGALIRDHQIENALIILDSIVFEPGVEYDPYHICYYSIDRSIVVYLSGNKTHALDTLKNVDSLIPMISATRGRYYQKYYETLNKVMCADSLYNSLQSMQDAFAKLQQSYLSPNWDYFKMVYLFSDLQIWSDF